MIYRDTPIDSSLLSLFVHQNYTLFCNEVDESDALSEWLSISDRFLANDGVSVFLSCEPCYVADLRVSIKAPQHHVRIWILFDF